jgi:hypothetical protein
MQYAEMNSDISGLEGEPMQRAEKVHVSLRAPMKESSTLLNGVMCEETGAIKITHQVSLRSKFSHLSQRWGTEVEVGVENSI